MNYNVLLDKDPVNKVRVKIKSGKDYPYGDIVLIEFSKEVLRSLDGYNVAPIGGRGEFIRVNLTRESILELIEVLKRAADEAVTYDIIDQ